MIYLDYAATTPLSGETLEEMLPYLREHFGNPDSPHAAGRKAAYAVETARSRVAETLGVKPSEVYFTAGGTEADNWAVRCLGEGSAVFSAIEHSAVREAAKLRAGGWSVAEADGSGTVTADAVERALGAQTGLVCVMAVNNETGCIQPLEQISALCRARGIYLFSDCVQAANECDLKELVSLCDVISLSGHKMYGPKGVGALIVKKGTPLSPLIAGGEQERGLRGGTLNAAGIVGFAGALCRAQAERKAFSAHTGAIRALFEGKILEGLGGAAVIDGENRVPNISHITFSGGGEALLAALDLAGVAASGGAACSSHSGQPSRVMLAMGRTEEEAKSGVRFSFGRETTKEEALSAAETVIRCALARN